MNRLLYCRGGRFHFCSAGIILVYLPELNGSAQSAVPVLSAGLALMCFQEKQHHSVVRLRALAGR